MGKGLELVVMLSDRTVYFAVLDSHSCFPRKLSYALLFNYKVGVTRGVMDNSL